MQLTKRIKNVLRGVKQRWGNSSTKRALWDREYAGGRWDHCDHTPGASVYPFVEKYAADGSILDLGCGSGNTGAELDASKYCDYTGVDISEVAVQKAAARSRAAGRDKKNRYEQGDVVSYKPTQRYDVILFRESIYYVPAPKMKSVLGRYAQFLTDRGAFVVHVSHKGTDKGIAILETIERNFRVLEKHSPAGFDEFVVVFR
jgi:SAM-dependent methyltransferase